MAFKMKHKTANPQPNTVHTKLARRFMWKREKVKKKLSVERTTFVERYNFRCYNIRLLFRYFCKKLFILSARKFNFTSKQMRFLIKKKIGHFDVATFVMPYGILF